MPQKGQHTAGSLQGQDELYLTASAIKKRQAKVRHAYVLCLQGGRYYVGSAASLNRRLKDHFGVSGGRSSVFCDKYPPVSVAHTEAIFGSNDDVLELEDKIALGLAKSVGLDFVRGGKLSGHADEPPESWKRFLDDAVEITVSSLVPMSAEDLQRLLAPKAPKDRRKRGRSRGQ